MCCFASSPPHPEPRQAQIDAQQQQGQQEGMAPPEHPAVKEEVLLDEGCLH